MSTAVEIRREFRGKPSDRHAALLLERGTTVGDLIAAMTMIDPDAIITSLQGFQYGGALRASIRTEDPPAEIPKWP